MEFFRNLPVQAAAPEPETKGTSNRVKNALGIDRYTDNSLRTIGELPRESYSGGWSVKKG